MFTACGIFPEKEFLSQIQRERRRTYIIIIVIIAKAMKI